MTLNHRRFKRGLKRMLRPADPDPGLEDQCTAFYRKIWHDDAVMHLYILDCIDSSCKSALDVGCGIGLDAPLALYRSHDLRYVGIDPNEVAIAVARKSLPQFEFVCGDIMEAQLPTQTFDLVYSNSVVEHRPAFEDLFERLFALAERQVIIGFYRGLDEGPDNEIRPIKMSTVWEPKYGVGIRDWDYTYLNTYSEQRVLGWARQHADDWAVTVHRLHSPMLPEHAHPAMFHAVRRTCGE